MATDTQTFSDKVSSIHECMFTTVADDGKLVSRPMGVQRVDGDTVYFLTDAQMGKVAQIRDDADVNLAFVDSSLWVSAAGRASIVRDAGLKEDLWNRFADAYFKDGPKDPNVVVVKVVVDTAEYWEAGSKASSILSILTASFTDREPNAGTSEKLDVGE